MNKLPTALCSLKETYIVPNQNLLKELSFNQLHNLEEPCEIPPFLCL